MTPPQVAPWQVWWTDFDPQVGREQAGSRPAIVVGTALACELPNDLVLLVPCTTRDRGLSFHPPVALDQPSFAMCEHVKSVRHRRLHPAQPQRPEIDAVRFVLRQLIGVH